MGECLHGMQEVSGSNPLISTRNISHKVFCLVAYILYIRLVYRRKKIQILTGRENLFQN